MHVISTGAAWPVGVHWNVFQPLLNAERAVGHTDPAYGVAPNNAAYMHRAPKEEKAEDDIFLPHLLHTARASIPDDTA